VRTNRYYDTARGRAELATEIRNIMTTMFQDQCWITQQHLEDMLFHKRHAPTGFHIIMALEEPDNDFDHFAENTMPESQFRQRHWWRIKAKR